jgi:hypothetical protein
MADPTIKSEKVIKTAISRVWQRRRWRSSPSPSPLPSGTDLGLLSMNLARGACGYKSF